MILIFTPRITNRVKYIFNHIFTEILKQEISFTSLGEDFFSYDGPKINYSKSMLKEGIFFKSEELLFERGIEGKTLEFMEYNAKPAFYPIYSKDSAMPFDPFAASFYLISRFEEYLPYVRDEFGRFQAKYCLAHKKGFLEEPLIDLWAMEIMEIVIKYYPELTMPSLKYSFTPTIDINSAFAFRSKGVIRTIARFITSLSDLNFKAVKKQLRVLSRLDLDPYNSYSRQLEIHKTYDLNVLYFVLFANYSPFDKNISINNRNFQVLIKTLGDYYRVGIHTSISSTKNPEQLNKEVYRLSKVLNCEIHECRQHFLYLNVPLIYRNFINQDLLEDYSMGYVNTPGFRASTCRPFYFYDLDYDTPTKLRIHPFSFMETALNNGYSLTTYKNILSKIKQVKGSMILLWNNESFSELIDGRNGINVYEEMIQLGLSEY